MTDTPNMREVDIDLLAPNPWNTNQISNPANEEKLLVSLRRFGCYKPIIVRELEDGGLQIIGGEHRWKGCKTLGLKTVPIANLGFISDERAKEIGLVDNGRYGEDDTTGLAALLQELGADVTTFLPYTDLEVQNVLDSVALGMEDLDNMEREQLPDLKDLKPAPTSQVMRFNVPVADVAWVTTFVNREMKNEKLSDGDSLSNAGLALISILRKYERTLT